MKKYTDSTLPPEERAELLTDEMTTEEQASQLRYDAPLGAAIRNTRLQLVERGASRSGKGRHGNRIPPGNRACGGI